MTLHRKMPSLHAKCFAAESQKAHERSISAAMLEILCAFRTALPQAVAAFADNRNATGSRAPRNKQPVTQEENMACCKGHRGKVTNLQNMFPFKTQLFSTSILFTGILSHVQMSEG